MKMLCPQPLWLSKGIGWLKNRYPLSLKIPLYKVTMVLVFAFFICRALRKSLQWHYQKSELQKKCTQSHPHFFFSSQFVSASAETEVSPLYLQDSSLFPSTTSLPILIPYAVFKFLSMAVLQVGNESRTFKKLLKSIREKKKLPMELIKTLHLHSEKYFCRKMLGLQLYKFLILGNFKIVWFALS